MVKSPCDIVPVGRRRDGGTRFWCLAHRADATAKYGKRADTCRYANILPISVSEELTLDSTTYPGGIALWGAVPPVYDTSEFALDRGIHVHAREANESGKCIDGTFRKINLRVGLPSGSLEFEILELDAIYFMVSSIFGFSMKEIRCPHCDYSHLDRDWFSLHPHRRHLCSGCGHYFRDDEEAIGNPLISLRQKLGYKSPNPKPAKQRIELRQKDLPGGIQIWGSNPSILWTRTDSEELGIHLHTYDVDGGLVHDDTYSQVIIDGINLDPLQVRILMAQNVIPHLAGRVVSLICPNCHTPHFSTGSAAFTPKNQHECKQCRKLFASRGRKRKLISNPTIRLLDELAQYSSSPRRILDLGLISETI